VKTGGSRTRTHGSPKKTIAHVAKKARVSMMTVSRAISAPHLVNEMTRDRVYKVIQELGYRPHSAARALARKNSRLDVIGVCFPFQHFLFTVDYNLRMLQGIEDAAEEAGYDLMIYNAVRKKKESDAGYARFLTSGAVDGLIIVAPPKDDPNLDLLIKMSAPFILLGCRHTAKHVSFVDSDNKQGARDAVEHLIKLGRRRIATITGNLNSSNACDRVTGYKQALKKHRLPIDDDWIVSGEFQMAEGYQAMKTLLSLPHRPDAVFCANDFMAVMAVKAIREIGLNVPKDIAVIGYDDNGFAKDKNPPLTSVRQPCYEMGKMACEKLIEFVEKKISGPHMISMPSQLIIRRSCGFE
jgi:LacI family transcriptional regulator